MKKHGIRKVLVIGSGAIKISEAGEFDYSASQCLKAMKEEKIKTVLLNPNIATIQSDEKLADRIYFLPITPYFAEKIIAKEKPDGILLGFGGQTALNCGVALHDSGVLKKYGVKVLGTPVETIKSTEDRELFTGKLAEAGLKTPESLAVTGVSAAIEAAGKIKYPVMIRSAYTLGGLGSAVCRNETELEEAAEKSFSHTGQILVEEYLDGWKEVEYEIVRDANDNCIAVCNMENFDPMGIHTGDSIVVVPSQTLTNAEYHKLRSIAIKLIRHLGIVGECNVQFALDPKSGDYRVIEVNARLSRSSALASKATGYPLAFVAAKLALGYSLTELRNSITQKTSACFEPAVDYVVVKIPRWDLKKFRNASRQIGSQMKSVGEVMAIGRKFEEALQKAIRMLDAGAHGLVANDFTFDVEKELSVPGDERLFAVTQAVKEGISCAEISKRTGIGEWFLSKIKNVVDLEKKLAGKGLDGLDKELMAEAKQFGFSDKQISIIVNAGFMEIRKLRHSYGIRPAVKQIDTLAAEYPAMTNYLYLTYNGGEDDVEFTGVKKAMILGSGVYRIGSSVEFDWCCVNAAFALKEMGYRTIMLNYNPETVSTDYDVCDKLYFDEISFETVSEIYDKENPEGVIISMGGQTPNNIATKLDAAGVNILGTSAANIDNAEDRYKFSKLLDELKIAQPKWKELTNYDDAKKFAADADYPVLVRPSYVLSGAAMKVAFSDADLETYLTQASRVNAEHPVVISKFIVNSKEIEIDAVASRGKIIADAVSEHVENAGVHSGDATMIFPPVSLNPETINKVKSVAASIAAKLEITGPFNIQFLAKENDVMVIECNLRASRSFPFVSKVSRRNMIETATRAIMQEKIPVSENGEIRHLGVKSPWFSFSRMTGADPVLSVEMISTGEVACLGQDLHEAFLKALLAAGFKLPEKNVLLSLGGDSNKEKFIEHARKLAGMGYKLYATLNTSKMLEKNGIDSVMLHKVREDASPNIKEYLTRDKLDVIINVPETRANQEATDGYLIRRKAADFGIPLITNLQLAKLFVESISAKKTEDLEVKAWDEY